MLNRKQLALALGLILMMLPVLPAAAQSGATQHPEAVSSSAAAVLTVRSAREGAVVSLEVDWGGTDAETTPAGDLGWPLADLNGYRLPLKTVALVVDDAAAAPFIIDDLATTAWRGVLETAADNRLPVLRADEMPDYILPPEARVLPDQPVRVLRDGRIRGHHVRVLAISPLFSQDGAMQLATRLRVTAPGARPLTDSITDLLYSTSGPVDILADASLAPPNAIASQNAVKLLVSQTGLQSMPLADLQAAGLDVSNSDRLGVMHRGRAVPARIEGGVLHFFADAAGDYWNQADVYWVSDTGANVARMASRSVAPTNAPLRAEAFESGVWQANREYTSVMPGPNRDHWFAARMLATSAMVDDLPTLTAQLENRLPLSGNGELILEVRSSTRQRAHYRLRVEAGRRSGDEFTPAIQKVIEWDSSLEPGEENDWIAEPLTLPVAAQDLRLTLLRPEPNVVGGAPMETLAELYPDEIAWRQRVTLFFDEIGAIFDGYDRDQAGADAVRYQLQFSGPPVDFSLYDITDPAAPVRLTNLAYYPNYEQILFQDATGAGRQYLATGPGTVHTPAVVPHAAANVTAVPGGAHLLYVAPIDLHTPLAQLTDYRATQECAPGVRCRVRIVDVQQIYDAYSFGYVDPDAIRQFLRYAVANWNPAPIAVTLVGDGTQDPKNYEGNQESQNLIPPYLAYQIGDPAAYRFVDPFIRRTGCDNCFAQLDGDDPLTGDDPVGSAEIGESFFPDMLIGRLPVKNAAEMRDLAGKLVRYETEYDPWDPLNEKLVFLADNFIKSCAPDGPRDTAGNFGAASDEIIGDLPDSLIIDRVYYDPPQIYDPGDRDGDGTNCDFATPHSSFGHREGNPWTVYQKVQATMQSAASLVTYNGHASQWRWAVTERPSDSASTVAQDAPEHLFYIWDVLSLYNADHPFVALSMSCLTSQFHKPVDWGMTLDEHLLLRANGGAVATWGSTGLSVASAHFDLERGFHATLWGRNGGRARMGHLVMGGYLEQYTESTCCDDVRRTFMIMGDPMTRVRMGAIDGAHLPIVGR